VRLGAIFFWWWCRVVGVCWVVVKAWVGAWMERGSWMKRGGVQSCEYGPALRRFLIYLGNATMSYVSVCF
jgi:hypothetical protein